MIIRYPTFLLTPIAAMILIGGCDSPDGRLVQFAEQAAEQQARQNEATAKQSQTVAEQGKAVSETAKHFVVQDAQARRELLDAHHKLNQQIQEERQDLTRQRNSLAQERDYIAAARQREPLVARSVEVAALIAAALLPLLVAIYALRQLGGDGEADELTEVLAREIAIEHPRRPVPTGLANSGQSTANLPPPS